MSYGTPSSRFGDLRPFVAASVVQGEPIIAVALNYRVSIFAFGDGEGDMNFALKDQRNGIEWVRKYIGSFGGDVVSSAFLSLKRREQSVDRNRTT